MISDGKMVSILRGYQSWTTEQPWKDIADRLEDLLEREKQYESSNRTVSEEQG